jgi:hypothetical protein
MPLLRFERTPRLRPGALMQAAGIRMRQIFCNKNVPGILPVDFHLPAAPGIITDRRAIHSGST